jgi:hypothetical protein
MPRARGPAASVARALLALLVRGRMPCAKDCGDLTVWPFKPAKTTTFEDLPTPANRDEAESAFSDASRPGLSALDSWNRPEPAAAPPAPPAPQALVRRAREPAAEVADSIVSRFTMLASDLPQSNLKTKADILWRRIAAQDAYGPSQPVTSPNMLAGRMRAMEQMTAAIEERRAHVVLYGPRGYGKTSLIQCLSSFAVASGYIVLYGSCGAETRFEEIFRNFLRSIPILYFDASRSPTIVRQGAQTLADLLPEGEFSPYELASILGAVKGTRVIFLLDEYDQTESAGFNRKIAETIKNLSDRSARVHLVLVGVASGANELMGYIPSIQRNLVGIGLTRLTLKEITQLVRRGEAGTNVRFSDAIIARIWELSGGSPYFARLVTFKTCMRVIRQDGEEASFLDLAHGLRDTLEDWPDETATLYKALHEAFPDGFGAAAIRAMARAGVAHENAFRVGDVVEQFEGHGDADAQDRASLSRRIGRMLHRLLSPVNGIVVLTRDPDTERYRCLDGSLPQYVAFRAFSDDFAESDD